MFLKTGMKNQNWDAKVRVNAVSVSHSFTVIFHFISPVGLVRAPLWTRHTAPCTVQAQHLEEMASSCFTLTGTLNLSLYIYIYMF